MGRGRAKAKQAKIARQLKYNSPEMDLESLQRELSGQSQDNSPSNRSSYEEDDYGYGEYDDYEDNDYSEWEDWDPDEDSEYPSK